MEIKPIHQHGQHIPASRYFGATLLRSPLFHLFIITIIGVLVYANTLHSPFELDDIQYITHETMRFQPTDILNAAKLIDDSSQYDTFMLGMLSRRFGFLTFLLNYKLHGLSVTSFHLVNIIIHLISSLLVYALIARCWHTPFIDRCFQGAEEDRERLSRWTAFLGAALFVGHPVNTQAVTYIVQRFTSLATLLYLLALLAYLSSALSRVRATSVILYGIAFIAAVLAMFTKEISFTLPAVMLLCDRLFLQRRLRLSLQVIAPFLLTMAIIPLNLLMCKSLLASAAGALSGSMSTLAGDATLSRHDYFLTELRVIATYLRLLFFPVGQNLDYDYPVYTTLFAPQVLASLLLLLSIAAGGLLLLHSSATRTTPQAGVYRLTAFGIFWFFITLSVESSIQPIENVIYEHRLYLPSFGFLLAIVCTGAILRERLASATPFTARMVTVTGLAAVIVLACVASTRNAVWRDSITLWEDVVRKSPNKARVHNGLGVAYLENGRIDDAERQFISCAQLDTLNYRAYYNLGRVALLKKQYDDALQYFKFGCSLTPWESNWYLMLGEVYKKMGKANEAYDSYLNVVAGNSESFEAHYNLGLLCLERQMYTEALQHFQKALQLDPSNINARSRLEWVNEKLSNSR